MWSAGQNCFFRLVTVTEQPSTRKIASFLSRGMTTRAVMRRRFRKGIAKPSIRTTTHEVLRTGGRGGARSFYALRRRVGGGQRHPVRRPRAFRGGGQRAASGLHARARIHKGRRS